MKIRILLMFLLIVGQQAQADCDAPDIDLEDHLGLVHGFQVNQFSGWHDENSVYYGQPQDNVEAILRKKSNFIEVQMGSGWLQVEAKESDHKFKEIKLDSSKFLEKIKNKLVRSEYDLAPYVEGWGKHLSISDIRGFDLTGNNETDFVIFGVSPGANVYMGAISIINGRWYKLINPSCH